MLWYSSCTAARLHSNEHRAVVYPFVNLNRPYVHHDELRSLVRLNPRFNMKTIHLPEPRSVPPIEI